MTLATSRAHRSEDALRGIHRLGIRSARIAELAGALNGLSYAHQKDLGLGWLARWIEAHPEIHDAWPASELRPLLHPLLENPNSSVQPILGYLRRIRSTTNTHLSRWGTTPAADFDPPQTIDFSGKLFCFTGLFAGFANVSNPRGSIENITRARGGTIHPAVIKRLDYLIVGSTAHPTWSFSTHGTKIARAHYLRNRYQCPIRILRESDWARSALATQPATP